MGAGTGTSVTRTPPWHAVPNDLFLELVRAGADAGCRDLAFQAWSYTATHRTDGLLASAEVRQFYSWNKRREALLVDKGFWRRGQDGFVVVGYLDGDLNHTKAEIEARAEKARLRQSTYVSRQKAKNGDKHGSSGDASNDV